MFEYASSSKVAKVLRLVAGSNTSRVVRLFDMRLIDDGRLERLENMNMSKLLPKTLDQAEQSEAQRLFSWVSHADGCQGGSSKRVLYRTRQAPQKMFCFDKPWVIDCCFGNRTQQIVEALRLFYEWRSGRMVNAKEVAHTNRR